MGSKNFIVGADGSVLVGRFLQPTSLEYFAWVRGEERLYFRTKDARIFTAEVDPGTSPYLMLNMLAESEDATAEYQRLHDAGTVQGIKPYVGVDLFQGGWMQLVQTEFEKNVADVAASGGDEDFVLEI